VSGRSTRGAGAADHDRARNLAATRLDEALAATDLAWLEDHLAACADCAAVAAEYDEQRVSLRAFRLDLPEPPRDLWARTAAALDAEGPGRSRRFGGWLARGFPMAPVAGLMVVAIAVSVGLLNVRSLFPDSTIKGDGPMPTPIDVAATKVQVLTRSEDGTVQVLTRRVDQMCPMGVDACGITSAFDVTTTASISGSADLDGIISPAQDRMVVLDRGGVGGVGGVYVVTMDAPPTPAPTATPFPDASGTPVPAATPDPSASPETVSPAPTPDDGSATPGPATPDPSASATPDPSASATTPDPETSPTPDPSAAATPDPSAAATPDPSTSPEPTPDPTAEPTPSIAVSPAPDGALEIARDVIVVGGIAAYAPDGSHFAFSARPADGSVGPDVYVWTVGDTEARAVTSDHASVFAGWLDGRLLVSRVADGKPETVLLDLADGSETAVGEGRTWRPAVGPDGRTAAWWDGSVTFADGGVTPVPDKGRLVLAAWPAVAADPQVLATGPLTDWDVQWDADGAALGVWTMTGKPGDAGMLSLYAVDPDTGLADLERPLIDGTSAYGGFTLRSGRLVWSAPAGGGDSTVQVAVWSGHDVNQLELQTEPGVTVVR